MIKFSAVSKIFLCFIHGIRLFLL